VPADPGLGSEPKARSLGLAHEAEQGEQAERIRMARAMVMVMPGGGARSAKRVDECCVTDADNAGDRIVRGPL
jgi:hypothetical protein